MRHEQAQSEYGFSFLLHALYIYVECFCLVKEGKALSTQRKVERRLIWSLFRSGINISNILSGKIRILMFPFEKSVRVGLCVLCVGSLVQHGVRSVNVFSVQKLTVMDVCAFGMSCCVYCLS